VYGGKRKEGYLFKFSMRRKESDWLHAVLKNSLEAKMMSRGWEQGILAKKKKFHGRTYGLLPYKKKRGPVCMVEVRCRKRHSIKGVKKKKKSTRGGHIISPEYPTCARGLDGRKPTDSGDQHEGYAGD